MCNAISKRLLSEALDLGLWVWSGVDGSLEEVIDSLCSTGGLDEALAMR